MGNADALNPQQVADLGDLAASYILYAQLSSAAAHPSIETLSRYFLEGGFLVMEPQVSEQELCVATQEASMAMLCIVMGVNDLLRGTETRTRIEALASEYKVLVLKGNL